MGFTIDCFATTERIMTTHTQTSTPTILIHQTNPSSWEQTVFKNAPCVSVESVDCSWPFVNGFPKILLLAWQKKLLDCAMCFFLS